MTSITEVKDKFSPSVVDFESSFEWLMATNPETSFASLAAKLKSYHDIVTRQKPRQLDNEILDRTLDLFYTLFYNVYNCTSATDLERFNIHMDIISHFFTNFTSDHVNKADILRFDIKPFLTSKKYNTWISLLELADKLSDKIKRKVLISSIDFDALLNRNDIFMHDFGIEALKSYYKG